MSTNPRNTNPNAANPAQKFKGFKYNDISDAELEAHLKLIKQCLVKYNVFDFDNQSAAKLSSLQLEDINIVLNHKTNFTRIKLFIDYMELDALCPEFAVSLRRQFTKYYKYVTFLTRKILLTSKKIKEDTSVFTDYILFNYFFIYSNITSSDIISLAKKKVSSIVSFAKCHVVNVKPPLFLLWGKKVYQKCQCHIENFNIKRYFNIFTKNINKNTSFSFTQCPICFDEFFHDTKSDIFLEFQEIEIIINTTNTLLPNRMSVFAFGDLVNATKPGDQIALTAVKVPEKVNESEKVFENGYFVALNINMGFENMQILNGDNFLISNIAKGVNKEGDTARTMKEIGFMRKITNGLFKLIANNYKQWMQRKAEMRKFNEDVFVPFLNIVMDMSLCQRDYYNHTRKIEFLNNSDANYLVEVDPSALSPNIVSQMNMKTKNKSELLNSMTNSRNLVFKSKLFNNTKPLSNINNIPPQNDFKKYFRLSKQFNPSNTSTSELLTKPLNLFMIFDDTKTDPIYKNVSLYSELYPDIITKYPNFLQCKYDKVAIGEFFLTCNNKIVLIEDIDFLTKSEIDIITNMINNTTLNITFWICCGSHKINDNATTSHKTNQFVAKFCNGGSITQLKIKNFENIISKFEIVLNFSKRMLKAATDIDVINENNYTSYVSSVNSSKDLLSYYNYVNKITSSNFKCTCNDNTNSDSFLSAKLIEDFFVAKREISKATFDDLVTLLRFAIFLSIIRKHYENSKIYLPSAISNVDFTDAMYAILIYEEICGIKYGKQVSSFESLTDKLFFFDYATEIKSIFEKKVVNQEKMMFMPRSKTMKKSVVMNEFNDIFIKKGNDINCYLCREIEKIQGGREMLCDYIEKMNAMLYNKEFNVFN